MVEVIHEEIHDALVDLKFKLLNAFHSASQHHMLEGNVILFDKIHSDKMNSDAFKHHLIEKFKSSSIEKITSCSDANKEELKNIFAELLVEVEQSVDTEIQNKTINPIEFFANISGSLDAKLN
ncbi:MAG: hypothetical protein ACQESE_04210 [Nanobdellota archaeon]